MHQIFYHTVFDRHINTGGTFSCKSSLCWLKSTWPSRSNPKSHPCFCQRFSSARKTFFSPTEKHDTNLHLLCDLTLREDQHLCVLQSGTVLLPLCLCTPPIYQMTLPFDDFERDLSGKPENKR